MRKIASWFYMTACSTHLQLPSTYGGRLLQPKPENTPCRGDMDPLNMKDTDYKTKAEKCTQIWSTQTFQTHPLWFYKPHWPWDVFYYRYKCNAANFL